MENRAYELLAPAGSYEGFEAALGAGADAVYVGGSAFGARAYAKNFTQEELLRAIDVAHIHDRKLYLTVNTLVKNRELEEQLYDYLRPCYEAGLDAVIVQDLGVFSFIQEQFPGMHLHASTQMTVTGAEGMRFLEKKGAARVVTARELSLAEIRRMHEASPIEIESFIHGALCYSFSGQCLMSSILGGRSGNRGRCAQPCRLPYAAEVYRPQDGQKRTVGMKTDQNGRMKTYDQKQASSRKNAKEKNRQNPGRWEKARNQDQKRYEELCPLSMRDMCTIDILPQILQAGVYSLKIEGRMKQPQYTAGVTEVYRKYLDRYTAYGAESYMVDEEDRRRLLDIFSRGGSCEGYYRQQNGPEMMAFSNEKKTGNIIVEIQKAKEKITGTLTLAAGEPVRLAVSCRETSVQVSMGEVQRADRTPMDEARIRQQMEKLGNTEFVWEQLDIQMEGQIFVPVSLLNECRREMIRKLTEALTIRRQETAFQTLLSGGTKGMPDRGTDGRTISERDNAGEKNAGNWDNPGEKGTGDWKIRIEGTENERNSYVQTDPPLYVSCETKEQARAVLTNKELTGVYVNFDAMQMCMELGAAQEKELYLSLPHIVRGELPDGFLHQAELWLAAGMHGFLVRNLEGYAVLKAAGYADRCVIDHSLYTWNGRAVAFWEREGILRNTAPLELSEKELLHRQNAHSELLIYGYLPMMISAQCVQKNLSGCRKKEDMITLTDRYDTRFPVVCHCDPWKIQTTQKGKYCYNIIYNSISYGLIRDIGQVSRLGMRSLRLAFTLEKPEECRRLLEEYLDVCFHAGTPRAHTFTRGHFKRGAE